MELKESAIECKYFIVKYSLKIKDKIVQTHALIDCGATEIAFVDKDFVDQYWLEEKDIGKKSLCPCTRIAPGCRLCAWSA